MSGRALFRPLCGLVLTKAAGGWLIAEACLEHDHAGLLLQIESMRLAFSDTLQYCGDPDQSHVALDELLSKPYARKRRADLFSPNKVQALHADATTSGLLSSL